MTIKPFICASISVAATIVGACFGGYLYFIHHDGNGAAKVLVIAAIVIGFLFGESEK